jgi:hypothetical protein
LCATASWAISTSGRYADESSRPDLQDDFELDRRAEGKARDVAVASIPLRKRRLPV